MKKKIKLVIILVAVIYLLFIIGWKVWSTASTPLLENVEDWSVVSFDDNVVGRTLNIESEELLLLLSDYERERTDSWNTLYFVEDIQILICLENVKEQKSLKILLGDKYLVWEDGSKKHYQIVEGEQLLEEVLALAE